MKVHSVSKFAVLSLFALAPLAANSSNEQQARACVDAFVAEQLNGREPVSVHISYQSPLPLVLRDYSRLHLEATDKASGRTIAAGECSTERGTVTVKPVE